ncbi:hypothetical protein [Agarivorans litoreus]|uniref:hypothetical protein n=1 Tax=Agarivorans litoreus TaxID=1510455 RepID=UPI001C7D4E40|nr:hypothetical protein [Agarivorans litoreus]
MRKIAKVSGNEEVKRIMLYECEDGVYLFEYNKEVDSSATADYLQDTAEIVYEIAEEDYGVKASDWQEISDPMEFCQHDRINPVRVVGRNTGNPQWGKLETLVSGSWVPLIE